MYNDEHISDKSFVKYIISLSSCDTLTIFVLTGATCDGQYITGVQFENKIKERIPITSDKFAIPVTWDPGHLANLAVNDVMNGKYSRDSAVHMER